MTTGSVEGLDGVRLPRPRKAPHPAAMLAAFVIATLAIGLSQQGASGVIQDQARDFDTTVDVIGYSIVAYALGVVVGAPLIMVGLAAWDRRRLLLTMSAVFVVTSIITLLVTSVPALLVARFLNGLPLAKWWPAMFEANGDCTKVDWTFLGLTIANWSFLWFVAFGGLAVGMLLARRRASA